MNYQPTPHLARLRAELAAVEERLRTGTRAERLDALRTHGMLLAEIDAAEAKAAKPPTQKAKSG